METSFSHPGKISKEKRVPDQIGHPLTSLEESFASKPNPLEIQKEKRKVKELRGTLEFSSYSKKAEFTKDTLLFFQHIGIDASKVDPIPLGVGANHAVYKYLTPENTERVIKLTRPGGAISTMNKGVPESENIQDVQRYFGSYFPKTEFKNDDKTGIACQIQDVVEGEPITDKNYNLGIKKQLQEIGIMNQKAFKEKKIALDMLGMDGLLKWLSKQFNKLFFKRGTAQITNLLVDKQGKVKIIDTDFYRFNDPRQSFPEKAFARVAQLFTRIFIAHYFRVNV